MPARGTKASPETRARQSAATRAALADPEVRERKRVSALAQWSKLGPKERAARTAKMLVTRTLRHPAAPRVVSSPEERAARHNAAVSKRSIGIRAQWATVPKEQRKARHPWTPESRKKLSVSKTGEVRSLEFRSRMAGHQRRLWAERDQQTVEHYRAKCRRLLRENMRGPESGKETRIEKVIRLGLYELGVYAIPEVYLGRYRVDFLLLDYDLVVECDGRQHETPEAREKDRIRDRWLMERFGLRVIRFSSRAIIQELYGCLTTIEGHVATRLVADW